MGQSTTEGAKTFRAGADAYDRFMGVYSRALSPMFADLTDPHPGQRALDVGCGPGALINELVSRLDADHVAGCDPSPGFLAACQARFPDVDLRAAPAENIPFADGSFDLAYAQLVFHFVSDPNTAALEMRRVVAPGGRVAVCVWSDEMALIAGFWAAAHAADPEVQQDGQSLRFGRPGEIGEILSAAGLTEITEHTLDVPREYSGFDELWGNFELGVGPAGSHLKAQSPHMQQRIRDEMFRRLGSPAGPLPLTARARAVVARVP